MLTRRFLGFKEITGPEQLQFDPNHPGRRIASPADYLGWHTAIVTTKGLEPWDSEKPARARINHGRWIADCIWCGGGMLTRPDWGVAFCGGCGARYHKRYVLFPRDPRSFERPLLVRVRRDQQNWTAEQSVEALELENLRPDVKTVADIERENVPELEAEELETER